MIHAFIWRRGVIGIVELLPLLLREALVAFKLSIFVTEKVDPLATQILYVL